jgi:hypothetical protein
MDLTPILNWFGGAIDSVKQSLISDYTQASGVYSTVSNFLAEQYQVVSQFVGSSWNTLYGDVSALGGIHSANVILHVQTMDSSTQSMINNSAQTVIDGLNGVIATTGAGWQIQKWGNYDFATMPTEIRFNMTESGSWPVLLAIALIVAGLAILYVIAVDVYDAATGQPLFGSSAATISPALSAAIQNLSSSDKAAVLNQALKTQAIQSTSSNPITAIGNTLSSAGWLIIIGLLAYFVVASGILKGGAEKVKTQIA